MKRIFILFLVSLTLLCQCVKKTNSLNGTQDHLIIESQGVGQFRVDKTKLDDIISRLGAGYREIKHENLRVEAIFDAQGLSFYFQDNDTSRTISLVIITQPFNGKTSKGIGVNSTMAEVTKAYGRPQWYTCDTCDTWTARYEGIEFEIERDKSLPKYPLDEEVHLKKKISKMHVYKTSIKYEQ